MSQAGLIDVLAANPTIPDHFVTDAGTAIAVLNEIEVRGGTSINTTGIGNVITANLDIPVIVAYGGTGTTTLTEGGLIIGHGTGAVTSLPQAADGELVIGVTGGDPVLNTLTAGANVTIVNAPGSITITADVPPETTYVGDIGVAMAAAGILHVVGGTGADTVAGANIITINASASVPLQFDTDAGSAVPALNILDILGGTGLNTAGALNAVTVNLDIPVIVANGGTGATTLTDGGIVLGSGTGAVTVTAQPTNGQFLIGVTGSDPVLATLTEGEAIDITNGAGTVTIACEDATDANKGVASFATADFDVTAGAVSLEDDILRSITAGDASVATGVTHNITITDGVGISTTAAAGSFTINSTGGGLNWVEITSTPTTLTTNTGHYINVAAGLATIPLPATAGTAADDILKVVGISAGGWIITQAAGQQVINGVLSSTAGVGGSTESSHQRDCVTLKYIGAGVWQVIDSIGNIGST